MTAISTALNRLEEIVGAPHLLTATQAVAGYTVDGQMPLAVALPESAEQVAALLRAAAESKLSVLLRGAGHHQYFGAPAQPIGLVLCLSRLNRITEYDPDDLTITAQAGVTLADLQQAVGEHGQMLPLDPPGPPTATLGGVIAANLSGPLRMRHGAPRDLVLGLRVALTSGEVIRTGGRTVKNVAGYDLSKLFVGSLGSVGVIVEATLRLVPVPEGRALLVAALPPEQAANAVARIVASRLELLACEVTDPTAAAPLRGVLPIALPPEAYLVWIGLGGAEETVARQERDLKGIIGEGAARVETSVEEEAWRRLRALCYPSGADTALARIGLPIAAATEMIQTISSQSGWAAVAHAGDGIVYARLDQLGDLGDTKRSLEAFRAAAQRLGGFVILEAGPVELKRQFPVWGDSLPNQDLVRALRLAFDAADVLGCGRVGL